MERFQEQYDNLFGGFEGWLARSMVAGGGASTAMSALAMGGKASPAFERERRSVLVGMDVGDQAMSAVDARAQSVPDGGASTAMSALVTDGKASSAFEREGRLSVLVGTDVHDQALSTVDEGVQSAPGGGVSTAMSASDREGRRSVAVGGSGRSLLAGLDARDQAVSASDFEGENRWMAAVEKLVRALVGRMAQEDPRRPQAAVAPLTDPALWGLRVDEDTRLGGMGQVAASGGVGVDVGELS